MFLCAGGAVPHLTHFLSEPPRRITGMHRVLTCVKCDTAMTAIVATTVMCSGRIGDDMASGRKTSVTGRGTASRIWANVKPDGYIVLLVGVVVLASVLPVRGAAVAVADGAADTGIVVLFFLHGARLSRQAVLDGARHWRLHLTIAAMTFVLFPVIGLAIRAVPWIDPVLATGLLFLTLLPSTVQSSIALTAVARGNVAAAVCSASFSNLAGIFVTPLLVALLIGGGQHGHAFGSVTTIVAMLLLPFVAGHLLRPWIGATIARHRQATTLVDRGSILLVVYTAFSAAVVGGLWSRVSPGDLGLIVALCAAVLAAVLTLSDAIGRWWGFDRADRITLQFCGSKKSLASGIPMAGVLFAAPQVGAIVLPLMIFHQMQLIVCAMLARRYATRDEA